MPSPLPPPVPIYRGEILSRPTSVLSMASPSSPAPNLPTSNSFGPSASSAAPGDMALLFSELEEEACCSICTELLLEAATLPCSHTFCSDCLQRWLVQQTVCPVCRSNVPYGHQPVRNRALDNLVERLVDKLPASAPSRQERQARVKALEEKRARESARPCFPYMDYAQVTAPGGAFNLGWVPTGLTGNPFAPILDLYTLATEGYHIDA
eukprot:TRINITY_DN617_c0_g1_i1.p1 TRINITY_DN617_c0_g1~~TRINITY_DN617_c0_g1_i1.p1  ORF type:complete len:209 (+),score=17.35 TRINITY_DN617_c0_g1_i1:117-743(+)